MGAARAAVFGAMILFCGCQLLLGDLATSNDAAVVSPDASIGAEAGDTSSTSPTFCPPGATFCEDFENFDAAAFPKDARFAHLAIVEAGYDSAHALLAESEAVPDAGGQQASAGLTFPPVPHRTWKISFAVRVLDNGSPAKFRVLTIRYGAGNDASQSVQLYLTNSRKSLAVGELLVATDEYLEYEAGRPTFEDGAWHRIEVKIEQLDEAADEAGTSTRRVSLVVDDEQVLPPTALRPTDTAGGATITLGAVLVFNPIKSWRILLDDVVVEPATPTF